MPFTYFFIIILLSLPTERIYANKLINTAEETGAQLSQSNNTISKTLTLNIEFNTNSSKIQKTSFPLLNELGNTLVSDRFRGITMVIAGHTDEIGNKEYNKKLSLKRAQAVRQYLLRKFNLSQSQLLTFGFGENNILEKGNHPLNRRVEIIPAEKFNKNP